MYLFNNYYVWDIFLGSNNAEINETTFLCLKTEIVKETNNQKFPGKVRNSSMCQVQWKYRIETRVRTENKTK